MSPKNKSHAKQGALRVLGWVIILLGGALILYRQHESAQPPSTAANVIALRNYADALPSEDYARLTKRLTAHNRLGKGQIQLELIEELPAGTAISDYATRHLRPRPFQFNDKALLLVVLGEEKLWLQAGANASRALTEAESQAICENVIRPHFQQRRYVEGLEAGISAIERELAAGVTPQWQANALLLSSLAATILLYLICLYLASVLLISMHEASHAVIAYSAGLRVARIMVGYGRPLWHTRLGATKVTFHRYQGGGGVVVLPRFDSNSRLGFWLMIFAGPGSHLLLGLCLLAVKFYEPWRVMFFSSAWYPLTALMNCLFYMNWMALLINALPIKALTSAGLVMTDGYKLWRIPFFTDYEWGKFRGLYFANEASALGEEGELHAAQELCQRHLMQAPANEALLFTQAGLQLDLGNYEQGRTAFAALLCSSQAREDEYFCWLAYNQVAYADALWNLPELREEANLYSEQSLHKYPKVATFLHTRGAVLVRLNRVKEGIEFLQEAHRLSSEPKDIAERAAWLALAHAYANEFAQAERWLKQAQQLRIPLALLAEAEHEIAARRAPVNPSPIHLPMTFPSAATASA